MEWFIITEEGEVDFATEEVKLVPEVKAVLTLSYNKGPGDFEGRQRKRAKQEIRYLLLLYSLKSPYRDYSASERELEARKDCGLSPEWQPSKELQALIPKFKRGRASKAERILATTEEFVDKFDDYLKTIDLKAKTKNGSLLYDPKDIMATLERLPRLLETLGELEIQVRTGTVRRSTSSRGDYEIGLLDGQPTLKPATQ